MIPNFVDVEAIRPMSRFTGYRSELGIGDRTVVMYAGNLGHSQSAIERLAGNPAERQVMGERGRQWAEAWRSPESIATTYADLVSDLASRHG